jgi:hypothetical protein
MTILRAQVTIPRRSNVHADACVNTFGFNVSGAVNSTELDSIAAAMLDFYNGTGAVSGQKISDYLSGGLNASVSRLKVYDLADAEPRPPVYDEVLAINNNASTNHLPGEVALCLSFKADPEAGVPPARRRGRVYIGPLSQGAIGSAGNYDLRPLTNFQQAIVDAGARLVTDLPDGTANEVRWCVISNTPSVGAFTITQCWADNAFDTQRRRGVAATSRILGF